jgi:hypothetical protein
MGPGILAPRRAGVLAIGLFVVLPTGPPADLAPPGRCAPAHISARYHRRPDRRGVDIESVEYRGRSVVRLTELSVYFGDKMAIVDGVEFTDGTVDVRVAGMFAAGAVEGVRGFIGIAFRVRPPPAA